MLSLSALDAVNHKTSCSPVKQKDRDHHKTLSSCCSPRRMPGMFSIQERRKQSNKYLSHILWGQASAGPLIRRHIWNLCKSASPSALNRWRSNNVRRLCWHCQLRSGNQNTSEEQVKTRADSPTWMHEKHLIYQEPKTVQSGLRFTVVMYFNFHWPELVTPKLKNVSLSQTDSSHKQKGTTRCRSKKDLLNCKQDLNDTEFWSAILMFLIIFYTTFNPHAHIQRRALATHLWIGFWPTSVMPFCRKGG